MKELLVAAFAPNRQGEANCAGLYLRALLEGAPDWRYAVLPHATHQLNSCTEPRSGTERRSPPSLTTHIGVFKV